MRVLVTQPCLALCEPTDCSPPGSSVHVILQAKYWIEWPFPSPEDLPDPWIDLHCRQTLSYLRHQGSLDIMSIAL